MNVGLVLVCLVIVFLALVYEWNIARITEQNLQTQLTNTQAQFMNTQTQLTYTQAQLSNAQTQLTYLQAQVANMQIQLAAPTVPVTVSFHETPLGPGLVGQFRNTSTKPLVVVGIFINPALNKTVQKAMILQPGKIDEIGYDTGFAFYPGDTITLSSAGYGSVKVIVP